MKACIWMLSGLLLVTTTAQAQSGDWARLEGLKRGTSLVIETNLAFDGDASFDRCRIESVDATTLTCVERGRGKARLVFPRRSLDAVYRVKHPWFNLKGFVALGVFGCLIGGLASGNPPAIVIGVLGSIILGAVAAQEQAVDAWNAWNGIPPNPLPNDEARELLYVRPTLAATGWHR